MHLFESSAEPLEHSLHVTSLLHGNDPGMVLLIDPNQKGLLIVVPRRNSTEITGNRGSLAFLAFLKPASMKHS